MTVTECKRLQTVPDTYAFPVSDTQAYKMLGNGWTVDVIAHIMSHFTGLTEEAVEVLSMYDGMSCGHIALDKLGAEITAYYATEIDKYAVQTTQHNFPDTVQLGDAFQVRAPDWELLWKEEHTRAGTRRRTSLWQSWTLWKTTPGRRRALRISWSRAQLALSGGKGTFLRCRASGERWGRFDRLA